MWRLYSTAKMSRSRPSDLVTISDAWAALQFDNAVSMVGNAIEGALHEMQEVGGGKAKKMQPKYRIDELLEPDFRLPRPKTAKDRERDSIRMLRAMAKQGKRSNVKIFKARAD